MPTLIYDRDRLVALMKRDALRLGSFPLASGRTSSYYVDARNVTLSAEGSLLIGTGILRLCASCSPNLAFDSIGGLTMGADPIVTAVLMTAALYDASSLRGFLVRKEPKPHGTGNLIEGPFHRGDRVLIVDDVATSGGSLLRAVDAVEAAGGTVAAAMVVLDRLEGAGAKLEARGIGLSALLTIRDLGVEPTDFGDMP